MFALYEADSHDYIPWFLSNPQNGYLYSYVALALAYSGKFGNSPLDVAKMYPTPGTGYPARKEQFRRHACPESLWLWTDAGMHQSYASNYVCNFAAMGMDYSSNAHPSLRTNRLKKASQTFLLADGVQTKLNNIDNSYYIKESGNMSLGYIHNNSCNAMFADGRAAAHTRRSVAPFAYANQTVTYGPSAGNKIELLFE